ncbi:hypothetical protein MMC24_000111 [Lignoscripta atroalba]|nr:hypothetical protein [Lignoscripta atroalba]
MKDVPAASSAILYQNPAKTVTLIDIPTSISLAQRTSSDEPCDVLLSSAPRQDPYESTEPKSESARANVLARMGSDTSNDHVYETVIANGLQEISSNYKGNWCLPRKLSPIPPVRRSKKRKLNDTDPRASALGTVQEPDLRLSHPSVPYKNDAEHQSTLNPIKSSVPEAYTFPDIVAVTHRPIHNPYATRIPLHISSIAQPYRLPPHSTFFLTTINEQTTVNFTTAASTLHCTATSSAGRGQFDFILLDPPWENRSVRRSRKYNTLVDADPIQALANMMDRHIAPSAVVACWITNKASVRDSALKLFKVWNLSLIEEWVWVKTTEKGEPTYNVDGLWRKPYEILLIGRMFGDEEKEEPQRRLRRSCKRLVVGVPDLHSRKPNLKELIEPMMPNPAKYRALEVFARNLTAGWWAWGDEVLKFNWDGHWSCVE